MRIVTGSAQHVASYGSLIGYAEGKVEAKNKWKQLVLQIQNGESAHYLLNPKAGDEFSLLPEPMPETSDKLAFSWVSPHFR